MSLRRIGFVVFVAVVLLEIGALGAGLRSIGVRVVLPIGEMPFLIGIEATTDLPFGLATGSFFLAADGKTLITASCDVRAAGSEGAGGTFLRVTAGLVYFDRSAFLPSLVFGGGLMAEMPVSSALAVAASGEFLYPIAFPLPMVSASGRWLVP